MTAKSLRAGPSDLTCLQESFWSVKLLSSGEQIEALLSTDSLYTARQMVVD
jgi:hypothetical protein